jgi:hypothetical protein
VPRGWELVIDLGNPFSGIEADLSQPGRITVPFLSELDALSVMQGLKVSVVRAKQETIQGEVVKEDHDPGQQ